MSAVDLCHVQRVPLDTHQLVEYESLPRGWGFVKWYILEIPVIMTEKYHLLDCCCGKQLLNLVLVDARSKYHCQVFTGSRNGSQCGLCHCS